MVMPFYNIPPLVRPRSRHTFRRLRSFYLSPPAATQEFEESSAAIVSPSTTATSTDSTSTSPSEARMLKEGGGGGGGWRRHTSGGSDSTSSSEPSASTPQTSRKGKARGSTVMLFVALFSVFLVLCVSLSFIGADVGDTYFKSALNKVALQDPGLVLVGESIDVDIDEPSVTIRWSVVACGEGIVLPASNGILGSSVCGLPNDPLQIFVDSREIPAATYNPEIVPYAKSTGIRRMIDNLVRFDTVHVLDVHKARLYPFDRYMLSTTLRASSMVNGKNETRRISRVLALGITANFDVQTSDVESFVVVAPALPAAASAVSSPPPPRQVDPGGNNATVASTTSAPSTSTSSSNITTTPDSSTTSPPGEEQVMHPLHLPSIDIDMHITRPPSAQLFIFLLFTISWLFTHLTIGLVVIARKRKRTSALFVHLLASGATLVGIPLLRRSMPDAPGLDGILLDCIGFFPQMIIVGTCIVLLLLTLAAQEIDAIQNNGQYQHHHDTHHSHGNHQHERDPHLKEHGPGHGHGHEHHCCRASLISSFPQPPATAVPDVGRWDDSKKTWKAPFPPLASPQRVAALSMPSSTTPLAVPAGTGGLAGRKQPPKPLSLQPRSAARERFDFGDGDEVVDVDLEVGVRRTVSSRSHKRAKTTSRIESSMEVSRWSDHEED